MARGPSEATPEARAESRQVWGGHALGSQTDQVQAQPQQPQPRALPVAMLSAPRAPGQPPARPAVFHSTAGP